MTLMLPCVALPVVAHPHPSGTITNSLHNVGCLLIYCPNCTLRFSINTMILNTQLDGNFLDTERKLYIFIPNSTLEEKEDKIMML